MTASDNKPAPYSKHFDDVYFSRDDGAAETDHVFLRGNNLPDAWHGKDQFTIIETGFGTGLNVFMSCALFDETTPQNQTLKIISFEKYPLTYDEILDAMAVFDLKILNYVKLIKNSYPDFAQNAQENIGLYNIEITPRIHLQLYVGDINDTLPDLHVTADCWFLDGFKPATNPAMWSETVFDNMARLSRTGTTFSTFTAAGFVRRGLQGVGFDVQKVKGFRTKREMLTGVYI